jgi:hypothetical protein
MKKRNRQGKGNVLAFRKTRLLSKIFFLTGFTIPETIVSAHLD